MGAGLMKDLVAWGFKNTGQAITLNDLSATLQRASAPRMGVQSVSVAQSPQMAMALR